jgi:ADP-ribose 1''-phosphate phosphatase
MSKQTRLNFGQASSAPAKRRRLNTSESSAEVDHDDENQKPSKSSAKARITDQDSSTESETTKEPKLNNSIKASQQNKPSTSTSPSSNHITLTHHQADLFTAPPLTLLCHATNAQGTWGAGIAAAFKKSYPAAFKIYATHCAKWPTSSLLGTTLLIPPQNNSFSKTEREANHWIGCLFTSERKGKGKGSKESILEATGDAVRDLVRRVKDINEDAAGSKGGGGSSRTAIASLRMCKINSGLFGVPWGATCAVVEGIEVEDGDLKELEVFSMD